MDRVRKQLHIDKMEQLGLTGENITVCILDSGIFMHRDIKDRLLCFEDFTDDRGRNKVPYDDCGHGTHVSGILAGNGLASNGKYRGVAPKVNLVVGKILDREGKGQIQDLVYGLEWILKNHEKYHIRIVNISIGIPEKKDWKEDEKNRRLLQTYLSHLYTENILVVTAAGNLGPARNSLSVLGEDMQTICVGCHDGDMYFAGKKKCEDFSGRGPTIYSLRKPDVVAPGTEVMSCSNKNPFGYVKKSGTSMACPIVSGLAALYLEKRPDTEVPYLMNRIRGSAIDLGEPWSKQGYGMIDAMKLLG